MGCRGPVDQLAALEFPARLLRAVFLNETRVASELISVFQKSSFFSFFNVEESFDLGFQMPTFLFLAERGQGTDFQRYSGIL